MELFGVKQLPMKCPHISLQVDSEEVHCLVCLTLEQLVDLSINVNEFTVSNEKKSHWIKKLSYRGYFPTIIQLPPNLIMPELLPLLVCYRQHYVPTN